MAATSMKGVRLRRALASVAAAAAMCSVLGLSHSQAGPSPRAERAAMPMVVFGYNDLGMHCMNSDFSEIMVLPPFNNLHAQVIRRGGEPHIITSGVTVSYVIPANTHSADKTNFWKYAPALLGASPPPDVGLTGNGLAGTMAVTAQRDWEVTGVPITPIDDARRENPYPLATITVTQNGTLQARTQAVVPVSTEMNCILCHDRPGISTASDILQRHDELHGTNLMDQRPVLCASCHASNALGLAGDPNLPNLSARHARRPRQPHGGGEPDRSVLRLPPGRPHAVPA